jgi:hypothetical protein
VADLKYRYRAATVLVRAPLEWLTSEGETDEAEGWRSIEQDLPDYVVGLGLFGHWPANYKEIPQATFEEWNEDPKDE